MSVTKSLMLTLLCVTALKLSVARSETAGDSAVDDAQQLTVVGTRLADRVGDTAKPTTFIDRARIDELNPSTIFDVLDTVPGLSVARSGGLEGQISLRGFNSNYYHSPLFIDGDRFKGRNTLEYLLLEPEDIERVEVLRGPAAEAYGSEAVGGVVLINTRHATPQAGAFEITGGGESLGFASVNDEVQAHGDVQLGGHGMGASLSVSGRDAGNYETPEGIAHNSGYKTGNISGDFAYALDDSQRLDLSAREISLDAQRAGGIGGAPGYPYVQQRDVLQAQMLRLAYAGDFTPGLFRHVDADVFVDHFNGEIPSINRSVPQQVSESISYVWGPLLIGGNLVGLIPWHGGNSTVGLDFFDEMRPDGSQSASSVTKYDAAGDVISQTSKPRTQTTPGDSQVNVGLFADNAWTPNGFWTLTGAARLDVFQTKTGTSPVLAPALQPLYADNTDRTNVAPTGSLGAMYHITPTVDLVATVGNTFRMPSDTELFSTSVQGTGYALPNPALQPERGTAVEGGFRVHTDRVNVGVTAYYDRYHDFVESVPVIYLGTSSTQPQNVQRVQVDGVEGELDLALSRTWSAYGNFTYTCATDLGTEKPLPYIAPFHGLMGLRVRPQAAGNVMAHVELEWSAAKTRIDPSQEYPVRGYAVANVGADLALDRYSALLRNTRLIASVDNLFNVAYRSGATYANTAYPESTTNPLLEPGRNVRITLRRRF
jgi:hemoglobin/transferrin/lactoferrin receptor protein